MFPGLLASIENLTHLPLEWVFFLCYCLSIGLFVAALRQLAKQFFPGSRASQWAAVILPAALWTMPVAGTALFIMDQHLHPRNLATIALLWAVSAALDRKFVRTCVLALAAAALSPLCALYGVSLLVFLFVRRGIRLHVVVFAFLLPAALLFLPYPVKAVDHSIDSYLFLGNWEWFELLGIAGPLLCLGACALWDRRRTPEISAAAGKLLAFGLFWSVVAVCVCFIPSLMPLVTFQPMRSLQLIFLFLILFAAGHVAELLAQRRRILWFAVFLVCCGMYFAQIQEFPSSRHVELPGDGSPRNPWLQGFRWIRQNTSKDAYFVMNPRYLDLPGEDSHGFRALAERGMLADGTKDRRVAVLVPALAPRWNREANAQLDWQHISAARLHSLRSRFGVDWVLLERSGPWRQGDSLPCPYQNEVVRICRVY